MAGLVFTGLKNEVVAPHIMSMNTTCPHCGTSFRVNSEQLAAREGKLRCGRCAHVFNGFLYLGTPMEPMAERSLPLRPTETKPDTSARVKQEKPSELPIKILPDASPAWHARSAEPALPAEFLAKQGANYSAPPLQSPPAPPPQDHASAYDDVFDDDFPEDELAQSDLPKTPITDDDFPDIGPLLDDELAASRPTKPIKIDGHSPSAPPIIITPASSKSGYKPRITLPQAKAELIDTDAPDPLLSYFKDEIEDDAFDGPTLLDDAANKRAKPHWAWALGTVILFVLGALQAAYLYRVEIAQAVPDARPLMAQVCDSLGCQVGLPQNFDLLSIESSDLVADPQKPDQIELRATLRNRARYVQAFPHLDLILTNAQDETLVRRVIAPPTYLKAPATQSAGFAPNSEINLKLPFKAQEVKPAGYRLQLIYP